MSRVIQVAAMLVIAGGVGVCEDRGTPKPPTPPRATAPKAVGGMPKKDGLPKAGVRITNPANPAERLYRMTPDQRERALEKLPAAQQERIRTQLKWFDSLGPVQQQVVLNRAERLAALPPEKRREVVLSMQEFNRLDPDRRPQVGNALRRLQNATEEQRKAFFDGPVFHQDFTAEEQKILLDLSLIMRSGQ